MAVDSVPDPTKLEPWQVPQRLEWIESLQTAIQRLAMHGESEVDHEIVDLAEIADHLAHECRIVLNRQAAEVVSHG